MKTITIDGVEYSLLPKVKFKVGDWVVFNNNHNSIYQISEIRDSYYILTHTHGGSMPLPFSQGNFLRPWSIEDAKDGDVLYFNDNTIVVFKDLYNSTTFHSYCHIEDDLFEISEDEMPDWWESKGFTPATKEQRELLFAKMKEVGYQWDVDKKELRKIKSHYDISNFQPFDKVLIRHNDSSTWGVSFFGFYSGLFMCCTNVWFEQCIPFNEDTKHLLGTTDKCSEEYINW